MNRTIQLMDRVVSIKSEGKVCQLVNPHIIRVNWDGIGELNMPVRLFRWDNSFKVWEIKEGREYV